MIRVIQVKPSDASDPSDVKDPSDVSDVRNPVI